MLEKLKPFIVGLAVYGVGFLSGWVACGKSRSPLLKSSHVHSQICYECLYYNDGNAQNDCTKVCEKAQKRNDREFCLLEVTGMPTETRDQERLRDKSLEECKSFFQ